MAGIAVDRKVDAVLIAGDVFDSPAPAARGGEARLRLPGAPRVRAHRLRPDRRQPRPPDASSGRSRPSSRACGSTYAPRCARPTRAASSRSTSRDGKEEARVAVLPFVAERRVVDACTVMDAEHKWYEAYSKPHRADPGRAREGPPGHDRQHRPRAPPGGRGARRNGGARAAPRPGLRRQPPAAPVDGPVHRPRPPPPPAGGPGPREDPLSRLPDRARLRRAGAGQERRRPRRATPAAAPHRARARHGGTTAAHGRGHAGRPAAPRGGEKRRLPARPREGRSPHARPRRPRQGAAPERPRRDGGPPSRRKRTTRARQGPRQARPRPALRCVLRAPEPDTAARRSSSSSSTQIHEEAAK